MRLRLHVWTLCCLALASVSHAFDDALLKQLTFPHSAERRFHLHLWEDEAKMPSCTWAGVPDDYTGRVEDRAVLFDCARSGLIVTLAGHKTTLEFDAKDHNKCTDVLVGATIHYDEKRNRIEMQFKRIVRGRELEVTAHLSIREEDELGFQWTVVGSECRLSYVQQVMLDTRGHFIGMLGLAHNAMLDAHESMRLTGEAPFCSATTAPSYQCALLGFGIYYSRFFAKALAVPIGSDGSMPTHCGVAVMDVMGDSVVPEGRWGGSKNWTLQFSGVEPLILANVNDGCVLSYAVTLGEFLGVHAPFKCNKLEREQAQAILVHVPDNGPSPSGCNVSACLLKCLESGLFIDKTAGVETACYTARQDTADECGADLCSLGMSTYLRAETTANGVFDAFEFEAEGNRTQKIVSFKWPLKPQQGQTQCSANFIVNKGEFLGVKAAGMDWDWAARQTGYTINAFLGAGMGMAVLNNIIHGEQFGSFFSFVYNVQFIGVAAQLGGRKQAMSANGTMITLKSFQPKAVETLSSLTAWSNFKGWGLINFGENCPSLTGEYELFDVMANILVTFLIMNAARLFIYKFGAATREKLCQYAAYVVSEETLEKFKAGNDEAMFPKWEITAVNAQIQGVSLAIGAAFGSVCSAYYNGAAVCATAVVIAFLALAWRVHAEFTRKSEEGRHSIRDNFREATWEKFVVLLDLKRKPSGKEAGERAGATTWLGCLQRAEGARASAAGGAPLEDPYEYYERKWAEMKAIFVRGEWKEAGLLDYHDNKDKQEAFSASFIQKRSRSFRQQAAAALSKPDGAPKFAATAAERVDREAELAAHKETEAHHLFMKGYSALFNDNMPSCWWYVIACHMRRLVEGIIVGTTYGTTNAALVFALNLIHFLVLVLAWPKVDSWQQYRETHAKLFDLIKLGAALVFVGAADMEENNYAQIFVTVTWIGIAPEACNVFTSMFTIFLRKRKALEKSITNAKSTYTEGKNRYNEAKAQHDKARSTYDEAKGGCDGARGTFDEVKDTYNNARGEFDEAKGKFDEAKGTYDEMKGNYAEAKGTYDEAKGKAEAARSAIAKAKERVGRGKGKAAEEEERGGAAAAQPEKKVEPEGAGACAEWRWRRPAEAS